MDHNKERKIDSIIVETTAKMEAIAVELQNIKYSKLDDDSKKEKSNNLRILFEELLLEQQRRVEKILHD